MNAEIRDGYFYNFKTELIPQVTWQEVLEDKVLVTPRELINILDEAREFLSTAEGPNLMKRRELAGEWFGWWRLNLIMHNTRSEYDFDVLRKKLCPIERVRNRLPGVGAFYKDSGVLNVAGAEGHAGHVAAAFEMSEKVHAIWAFEQDSYFKLKPRPAPFLPLTVRLWMWAYSPLSIVTVSPEVSTDLTLNDHYQKLFNLMGADRSFADVYDPNLEVKIRRGKPGPNGFQDNILHHIDTLQTSERVMQLFPGVDGIELDEQDEFMLGSARHWLRERFVELSPSNLEESGLVLNLT